MIYPSVDELTNNTYNRYELCIATAKCARIITERRLNEMTASQEKAFKKSTLDEKPVKEAIRDLYDGTFSIVLGEEKNK